MLDSDDADGRCCTLEMIARVLDVSMDAFFERSHGTHDGAVSTEQEAELLCLFRQITDAQTRVQCLGFLRGAIGRLSDG